jgi:hypothetical protein
MCERRIVEKRSIEIWPKYDQPPADFSLAYIHFHHTEQTHMYKLTRTVTSLDRTRAKSPSQAPNGWISIGSSERFLLHYLFLVEKKRKSVRVKQTYSFVRKILGFDLTKETFLRL